MPRVSVIMPVHDGAEFIAEAIQSVLAQTFRDWELIVVDDGSTDETRSVIAGLEADLIYLHQPQQGPSAARNHGLCSARGEYVAFLDADDKWRPDFLKETVAYLDRLDNAVVAIGVGWVCINREGTEIAATRRFQKGYCDISDLLGNNLFPPLAVLARTEAVLAVGGFDQALSGTEDWDLWLRLTTQGGKIFALTQVLAEYRLHAGTNSSNPDRMRASQSRTLEKFFAQADLSHEIRALEAYSIGRSLIQSSARLYGAQRVAEAVRDFSEAVRLSPPLLDEDETYYAIVCAEQPPEYKGSGYLLDLKSGERRIIRALERSVASSGASNRKLRARAYARAYATLARLAYAQRQMDQVRRYLRRAWTYDLTVAMGSTLALFLKSLLGAKLLASLKHLKMSVAPSASGSRHEPI